MNRTRRILSMLGLALALGTTLPACLVTAQGRMATGSMVAYDQPPPPRAENPQGVGAGYVWISGNWSWQNNQWVWIDGHVERDRAGATWRDGRWEPRNGSWHWVAGEWVAGGGATVVVGDGRPQVQDHRYDNQPDSGGAIVTHAPNGGTIITNGGLPNGGAQGAVIVNDGQGGLVATNGAGTVISQGGTVSIVGPTVAPPPPRVENPGQPRRGYTWIEGGYQWDQNARQYDWVPGHWERTKAKKVWVPFRWELRGNVYVRVGGEWR